MTAIVARRDAERAGYRGFIFPCQDEFKDNGDDAEDSEGFFSFIFLLQYGSHKYAQERKEALSRPLNAADMVNPKKIVANCVYLKARVAVEPDPGLGMPANDVDRHDSLSLNCLIPLPFFVISASL